MSATEEVLESVQSSIDAKEITNLAKKENASRNVSRITKKIAAIVDKSKNGQYAKIILNKRI